MLTGFCWLFVDAATRRRLINPRTAFDDVTFGQPQNSSGTVYFCVADPFGNACSFINSNFAGAQVHDPTIPSVTLLASTINRHMSYRHGINQC